MNQIKPTKACTSPNISSHRSIFLWQLREHSRVSTRNCACQYPQLCFIGCVNFCDDRLGWFFMEQNPTAGRIWWVAHRTNKILGRGYTRNYITAIAVMWGLSSYTLSTWANWWPSVESGIISSVYILIAAVGTESQYVMLVEGIFQIVVSEKACSFHNMSSSLPEPMSRPLFTQGIAPTLVIVQVLLGREVQDIQTTIKSANADCQVWMVLEGQWYVLFRPTRKLGTLFISVLVIHSYPSFVHYPSSMLSWDSIPFSFIWQNCRLNFTHSLFHSAHGWFCFSTLDFLLVIMCIDDWAS